MIKFIVKKKWLGKEQFGKIGVLVNYIIQKLKFCKLAQLFLCVSVSLVRGKSEKIERKYKTE